MSTARPKNLGFSSLSLFVDRSDHDFIPLHYTDILERDTTNNTMDSTNIKMPPADTVHPILKHPRDEGSPSKASKTAAASAASDGNKSDKSRHIAWDEHAIEEHDLLRGTRMKVRLLISLL